MQRPPCLWWSMNVGELSAEIFPRILMKAAKKNKRIHPSWQTSSKSSAPMTARSTVNVLMDHASATKSLLPRIVRFPFINDLTFPCRLSYSRGQFHYQICLTQLRNFIRRVFFLDVSENSRRLFWMLIVERHLLPYVGFKRFCSSGGVYSRKVGLEMWHRGTLLKQKYCLFHYSV